MIAKWHHIQQPESNEKDGGSMFKKLDKVNSFKNNIWLQNDITDENLNLMKRIKKVLLKVKAKIFKKKSWLQKDITERNLNQMIKMEKVLWKECSYNLIL